jgi:hypothetical protein
MPRAPRARRTARSSRRRRLRRRPAAIAITGPGGGGRLCTAPLARRSAAVEASQQCAQSKATVVLCLVGSWSLTLLSRGKDKLKMQSFFASCSSPEDGPALGPGFWPRARAVKRPWPAQPPRSPAPPPALPAARPSARGARPSSRACAAGAPPPLRLARQGRLPALSANRDVPCARSVGEEQKTWHPHAQFVAADTTAMRA